MLDHPEGLHRVSQRCIDDANWATLDPTCAVQADLELVCLGVFNAAEGVWNDVSLGVERHSRDLQRLVADTFDQSLASEGAVCVRVDIIFVNESSLLFSFSFKPHLLEFNCGDMVWVRFAWDELDGASEESQN